MWELRSRASFAGFAFLIKLDSIIKVNAHHILQEQDWLIGQSCGSISGHENREPSFVQTLVVIHCICYRCKLRNAGKRRASLLAKQDREGRTL